ncbi:MAG: thioredoxin domain-containing protein [Planctomycetota bacterium]
MPNRLLHETSPYLKQHAHNPVDWYPWGEEALKASRELDRPIFLSIGYSACHWCHVMERESFEDPAIGELLGKHFISIKVDREERPDLDQIYMAAVQILTQSGGWPMTVFLTPDLKPYYGGTYFPPRDLYGRPSFRRVVESLAKAWVDQRDAITTSGAELASRIGDFLALETVPGPLDLEILKNAIPFLRRRFDAKHGGFGQAPKFPHPMDLRLLLRLHARFGDDDALAMVVKSLDLMARGGMYDQLGGGFHRYSTDAHWLVPHFEKMLYDNALLMPVYLDALQITGDAFYRQIAEETLDYVVREMTAPDGSFYSTQDADSEGEEGKFFVWSDAEIEALLGKDDGAFVLRVYDVVPGGNWEGVNILHRARSDEQDALLHHLPLGDFQTRLAKCKSTLLAARDKRIRPARDEKILTAWSGLMIAAFAQAGAVLERPDYLKVARRAAEFVLTRLRTPEGRLLRTTFAGMDAKLNGYLEDYSYTIDGLVSLYEATFEPRWLTAAGELADTMIALFGDAKDGGFFYTSIDHETLIARNKDPHDQATPSGNSLAACGLVRLAHLTGRADFRAQAERTLLAFRGLMTSSPMAAGQMLIALDLFLGPVDEVAIVGRPGTEEFGQVIRAARAGYRPLQTLAASSPGDEAVALLKERTSPSVSVFLCREGTCQAPAVGVDAALAALRRS